MASLGCHPAGARLGQIREEELSLPHQDTRGDLENQILAASARFVAPLAVLAAAGAKVAPRTEWAESGEGLADFKEN
jgi:hypothetical protein